MTAPALKKERLLSLFQTLGSVLDAGMLLIDLRRTDYEGGTIRGSLNLPAQSFYYNMPTLYRLCKGDGVNVMTRVVFYCGSSSGRGPRCAAWFGEYIKARFKEENGEVPDTVEPDIKSFVLEGGVKGWAAAGEVYTQYMDGYVAEHWQQAADGNKRALETDQTGAPDEAPANPGGSPTKRVREEDTRAAP
jgi:arsenical-resistance protein 2